VKLKKRKKRLTPKRGTTKLRSTRKIIPQQAKGRSGMRPFLGSRKKSIPLGKMMESMLSFICKRKPVRLGKNPT